MSAKLATIMLYALAAYSIAMATDGAPWSDPRSRLRTSPTCLALTPATAYGVALPGAE